MPVTDAMIDAYNKVLSNPANGSRVYREVVRDAIAAAIAASTTKTTTPTP